MPGDLSNPEQSIPYHYDKKLEPGSNPFEPSADNLGRYIQTVALERNVSLSPEKLNDLVGYLKDKGFLCRNPGDESFRNEIFKYLDNIKKAGRVASKWLTLTS